MVKPVWNNAQRVNHQNFAKKTHPYAKKNMVLRAVLIQSGLVLVNTARQVNAAHSKTTVNAARPMSYLSKIAHSTVKRPIHKNTTFKNSNINQRVNTVRDKKFNTARPKATVNVVKGNNAVKALACWVWKLKRKVLDHVSKHNSASITLKKFDYIDAQGRSKGYVAFGGNPNGGKITGKGTIKTNNLDFENVYFMRELKFNLFSVSQMCDKKNSVLFNDTECIVLSPNFKLIDESQVLLRVPRKNNMYSVDLKNIVPKGGLTCLFAKATSDESKLWHRRLGHLNFKTMNKLVKGNLVRGLPSKLFENDQTCVACQKRKQHKASCKSKTENSISLPLHLLHMDLFGPTFVKSLMKKMYCLVVTDDYSRFTWVFFLATKDETSGILKSFITGIENLVDHKVKVIRSRTPQQNEVAERRNKTLIEAARTMLADSKLPTTFWAEAVNTACYVQNKVYGYAKITRKWSKPDKHGHGNGKNAQEPEKRHDEDPRKESECNDQENEDNVNNANNVNVDGTNEANAVGGKTSIELPFDLNMPALEDYNIFDFSRNDEDDGAEADMNNLDTTIQVSPNPTTRIHKDHPLDQVIRDLQSATQTRKMSKNLKEHGLVVKQKKDGIFISQDKYVEEILKKFKFTDVKTTSTPMETQKPLLKDEDGEEVDVHMYRLMIGSLMYLTSSRPDSILQCVPMLDTKSIQRYTDNDYQDKLRKLMKYTTGEAEYVVASSCCGQVLWIQNQLLDYGRDLQLEDAEGIDCLPNYTDEVPQPSDPSENVTDEVVHKELGDSLVRAATTASSLEAEKDSGNITKTRSKATPNESSSLGTTLGGAPRCQETLGDTIAQTRFENVSKHSNDSLLARDRVESSGDEESLGEDASKQGRINAIDTYEEITLVSIQDDADKEMFDVDALNGEEVFVAGQNEKVVKEEVDAAQDKGKEIMIEEPVKPIKKKVQIMLDEEAALKLQAKFDKEERLAREKAEKEKEANIALIHEWDDIQAKIDDDHQLAERLQAQEQEELSDAEKATLFQQLLEKKRKHFAAKRAEERRNKPPTKAQQRQIMCTYLKNMEGYKLKDLKSKGFDSIQEMFDRAFKRQKVEDDKETTELKQCLEIIPDEEKVTIDAIPLAVNHMLKSFSREDLEDLYKLVKAKYKSTRLVEDLDLLLWGDLKTMFEPHVEDTVWRNQQDYKVLDWKMYDSCGVHSLRMQHVHIHMLVEKKYPLIPSTLSMMLEKKLQIDYESEMAYQLLKFIVKQLKK
ncbi:putative ribonuclease H-like domain-containing protein [Tanacetum coccineum]